MRYTRLDYTARTSLERQTNEQTNDFLPAISFYLLFHIPVAVSDCMSSLHTARQVACPCPTTLQSSSRTRTQRTSHLWRGRGRGGLGSIRRRCSCSLPPAIIAPSWPPGTVKTEGGGGRSLTLYHHHQRDFRPPPSTLFLKKRGRFSLERRFPRWLLLSRRLGNASPALKKVTNQHAQKLRKFIYAPFAQI